MTSTISFTAVMITQTTMPVIIPIILLVKAFSALIPDMGEAITIPSELFDSIATPVSAVLDKRETPSMAAPGGTCAVSYTHLLNRQNGTVMGPSGKETYYNLNMSGVVKIMRRQGFSEEEYPYWVREDGCKMLGPYIMCAADLALRPRGSLVESSLGTVSYTHLDVYKRQIRHLGCCFSIRIMFNPFV